VVVDDGPTDGTRQYLRSLQTDWQAELRRAAAPLGLRLAPELLDLTAVRVVFHPRNRGKGAALRLGDGARRVLHFWHSLGNKALTLASNALTDLNLTDMETGYKVFRTDVLRSIHLTCDRFGFEPEVTAKAAKLGARIYEVAISYHGRTYEDGKKIGWKDGVAALWHIVRFNLFPGAYCKDAGHDTLRKLGAARSFNRYTYDTIAPHHGSYVLEVGAGVGNLTAFLAQRRRVVATDIDPTYRRELDRRFLDRAL
jgi:glycosyltransferase involved in cell wall biosynthesis